MNEAEVIAYLRKRGVVTPTELASWFEEPTAEAKACLSSLLAKGMLSFPEPIPFSRNVWMGVKGLDWTKGFKGYWQITAKSRELYPEVHPAKGQKLKPPPSQPNQMKLANDSLILSILEDGDSMTIREINGYADKGVAMVGRILHRLEADGQVKRSISKGAAGRGRPSYLWTRTEPEPQSGDGNIEPEDSSSVDEDDGSWQSVVQIEGDLPEYPGFGFDDPDDRGP